VVGGVQLIRVQTSPSQLCRWC